MNTGTTHQLRAAEHASLQPPEHPEQDIFDRAADRIHLMTPAELVPYMVRFCEFGGQISVETTDGRFVTTRRAVDEIFHAWLAPVVEGEIRKEDENG